MKTAFCFSMKDRVEISKKTLPPVLTESTKFDLFIVDGSATEDGKQYAYDLNTCEGIAGVHCNVTGGADVAIVFALSFMLERGYDYLGLIENDVTLWPRWFDRITGLFGDSVGAVSARCYKDRVLEEGNDFAIMANVGAGMVLFSRRGAEAVLDYYRTGSFAEYQFWPQHFTGLPCPTPHEVGDPKLSYNMTADWFFESSMMSQGLVAAACTPSLARSADQTDEALQTTTTAYASGKLFCIEPRPLPIGNWDAGLNVHTAQPHQIFIALPEAFYGEWQLTWAKHNGPFGMRTRCGSLTLPIYGTTVNFMLDITEGSKVNILVGGSLIGTFSDPGASWRAIRLSEAANKEIELQCLGDVTVMTVAFSHPQNWFMDGYGLRYSHLAKYL